MQIVVIGSTDDLEECKHKFSKNGHHIWRRNPEDTEQVTTPQDVVFDFVAGNRPCNPAIFSTPPRAIFLNTCHASLQELFGRGFAASGSGLFGFPGLRSFLNREVLEVSMLYVENQSLLTAICDELKTSVQVVRDVQGLATPRVICMIINEAWYALQDNTASRDDIDLAMKTGTNYPFGPFEWCDIIGGANVVSFLEHLYLKTGDERYIPCSLFKETFLARK